MHKKNASKRTMTYWELIVEVFVATIEQIHLGVVEFWIHIGIQASIHASQVAVPE